MVRETRLPPHYLRMMESNDYSEISDQLYLVPFLRRYAGFLELDQEDVAMRFVREVQRADGNPGPPRLDQPLVAEPRQHRGWTGALVRRRVTRDGRQRVRLRIEPASSGRRRYNDVPRERRRHGRREYRCRFERVTARSVAALFSDMPALATVSATAAFTVPAPWPTCAEGLGAGPSREGVPGRSVGRRRSLRSRCRPAPGQLHVQTSKWAA